MTLATETQIKNVSAAQAKTPRNSPGIFSSVIAWTIIWIVLLDCILPLGQQKENTKFDEHFTGKLNRMLGSQYHPDMIILGSSVGISSCFYSDASLGVTRKDANEQVKCAYLGAEHLKQQIRKNSGTYLSMANLSGAGGMISDGYMAVLKAVEFKRPPKYVVLETVSRDLFDSTVRSIGQTPYYQFLVAKHPDTGDGLPKGITAVLDTIKRSQLSASLTTISNDERLFQSQERLQIAFDSILSSLWPFYKKRATMKAEVVNESAKLLNRETSIYSAAIALREKTAAATPGAVFDPKAYSIQVDGQPQISRFESELLYFKKLLALCQKEHIKMVFVNMPVGEEYRAKVPPPLRKRYPDELFKIAESFGATSVNLDTKDFNQSDFIDFIHVNARGGVKVNELLSKELQAKNFFGTVK
ncbi:MAG: hypothetical protein IAF58_22980 [Leptolyngbya sp.]|nr:hypothetical protein [Candidatus Melainabacteria bacterium]